MYVEVMTMYRRIRDLREDHDLTQRQVAQMLGMSQTGYSKYETGENDIPTAILIKLADFYDVSIDYLLKNRYNMVSEQFCSIIKGVFFLKEFKIPEATVSRLSVYSRYLTEVEN